MTDRVIHEVKKIIGDGYHVEYHEVVKNNGVKRSGVLICRSGDGIGMEIYAEDEFSDLEAGRAGEKEIAEKIVQVYRKNEDKAAYFSSEVKGISKRDILDNVYCQMVNQEKNRDMLSRVPHSVLMDLAAVYRMDMEDRTASFVISRELCRVYGIGEEELRKAAKFNTELRGFTVSPVESVLARAAGIPEALPGEAVSGMYVFSNKDGLYGSAVLQFTMYFERLARKLGSDLYILPCSIHEVLAVPVSTGGAGEWRETVAGVNSAMKNKCEVLSENVYQYSIGTYRLAIA